MAVWGDVLLHPQLLEQARHDAGDDSDTTVEGMDFSPMLAAQQRYVQSMFDASNHTIVRGTEGLNRTLDDLDTAGLVHDGPYRTRADAQVLVVINTPNGRSFPLGGVRVQRQRTRRGVAGEPSTSTRSRRKRGEPGRPGPTW